MLKVLYQNIVQTYRAKYLCVKGGEASESVFSCVKMFNLFMDRNSDDCMHDSPSGTMSQRALWRPSAVPEEVRMAAFWGWLNGE